MKKQLTKFAQAAGIMLAMVFTFSCTSGEYKEGDGGGGGGSIINADNEAWIRCKPEKCYDSGLIFRQNEFFNVERENGNNWCISSTSKYSISGNQLCVNNKCATYSISGNTLTIVEGENDKPTFNRTSGVYLSGNVCEDD